MKKNASKADLRKELDQQVSEYLETGGEVTQVERGVSGHADPVRRADSASTLFGPRGAKRVYVPEVIATLEQRKRERLKPRAAPKRRRRSTPKRRLIYDDFGEPLRWVWENDE
jgi:hypothetical protein